MRPSNVLRPLRHRCQFIHVQRERVREQECTRFHDLIEFFENQLFHVHPLERGFHNHITVLDIVVAGDWMDARKAALHLVFAEAAAYHAPTLNEMPERYSVPVRLRLEVGRYLLAEDYARALTGREVLREAVDRTLEGYDALVLPTLPIAQFPNLTPPQVGVTSVYIGASAQTVESAVTIPIEQQINGAEGMKYITSTSGNDGSSSVIATFDLNRNPDLATVDIQNRVNTAQGRLPERSGHSVRALRSGKDSDPKQGYAPSGATFPPAWARVAWQRDCCRHFRRR